MLLFNGASKKSTTTGTTRIGVFLLTVIFLASFFVSLTPLSVSAAIKYSELDINQQRIAQAYARAVHACFGMSESERAGNFTNRLREDDPKKIQEGKLFYDNTNNGVLNIYLGDSDIEEALKYPRENKDRHATRCGQDGNELTRQALAVWGISGIDLVCAMDYKRETENKGCKNSGDDNRFKDVANIDSISTKFKTALKSLTGLDIDNPSPQVEYLRYIERLKSVCGVNLSNSNSDAKDPYDYNLSFIDGAGNEHNKGKYGGQKSRNDYLWESYKDPGTCGGSLDRANALYESYKNYIIDKNAEITCTYKGFTSAETLKACKDGVKNKAKDYCNKYDGEEKKACEWGQTQKSSAQPPVDPGQIPDDGTSCAIDGIGWIVCPVINFLAGIADTAYAFISDRFLKIDAELFNTSEPRSAYPAWSAVRNIANIAFVIAFIIIVYSQLTGAGIGNYGIKRLLPRLIIAAVLVNTSYILCQLAVDLSNVLGYGLRNIFETIKIDGGGGAGTVSQIDLGKSALVILAGGAAVALALPLLGSAVVAATVALVFIGLLLIIRKALVVLFVVISPLAFVAYLLPNTQDYFTRWRKMFVGLLMVFPVVGLLFGAGSLASNILRSVGDANDTISQLIAATVGIVPLFAVWPVLKGSLDSVGSIGAKINGVGKTTRDRTDAARKSTQEKLRNSSFMQYRRGIKSRRDAEIKAGAYQGRGGKFNPRNWRSGFNSTLNNSKLTNNPLTGNYGDHRIGENAGIISAADEAAVNNAVAMLDSKGLTKEQLQTLAKSGGKVGGINGDNETMRRAAIKKAMAQNSLEENEDLIATSGHMTSAALRNEVADGIVSNGLSQKAVYMGGSMVDKVRNGEIKSSADISAAASSAIASGKTSSKIIANQDAQANDRIMHAVGNDTGTIQQKEKDAFIKQAAEALVDKDLRQSMTGQQRASLESTDRDRSRFDVNHNENRTPPGSS